MKRPSDILWDQPTTRQLVQALCAVADGKTMQSVLRDLLTEKEIIEISARLEVARLLQEGVTYAEIVRRTKLSSRTVARTSTWLRSGNKGFATALKLINEHHDHMPPARA